MTKLYEIAPTGIKTISLTLTPTAAGNKIYRAEGDPDFSRKTYLLLHGGALYLYISAPGGYGWERIDGEDEKTPPFA